MTFQFSRQRLQPRERILQRVFEILPGATSWTILAGLLLLTFWKPLIAAVFVIAFDLYWLLRLFYMTLFLVLSSLRLSIEQETDWMGRVRGLDGLKTYLQELHGRKVELRWRQRLSLWMHQREIRVLERGDPVYPPSTDIYHVVIIPVAKETRTIIEPGIDSLTHQSFPSNQLLVVLAVEGRAAPAVQRDAREIQQQYRARFLDLLVVTHPEGLANEAKVKGANVTYAAKAAAFFLQERAIPFDHVVVSCFDADTVVSPQYVACLTYAFMTCPDRTQVSFQPIPVYHNNIWDVPGFARVLDIGSSFFQLIEATNPDTLVTFSSHSMSFNALVEVGYWPVDMISDDSAIFWKSLIHFDGRYRVVPLYVTVSMDIASAPSWWSAIVNVYQQKRRWAWGIENFPIVMRAFIQPNRIRLWTKLRLAFKLLEGHLAWATWAFLLTVFSWIPALWAGREFSDSILYYTAPRITATVFHLSSLSLLSTIILSYCLLPKDHVRRSWFKTVGLAFEWLLVPLISVFLSALPALDAQTRLMLGRYMEFWVTEKSRRPTKAAGAQTKEPDVVSTRETAYDERDVLASPHYREGWIRSDETDD